MKHLRRIYAGIDVKPILQEVAEYINARRISAENSDDGIWWEETGEVALSAPLPRDGVCTAENQETYLTPAVTTFPRALSFLQNVARARNAKLGRARIVWLRCGEEAHRVIDVGSYVCIRDRYHLILAGDIDSTLESGDEAAHIQIGDMWWLDNKQYYSAASKSESPSIHCIFDLLPNSLSHLAVNPLPMTARPNVGSSLPVSPRADRTPRKLLFEAISERALLRSPPHHLVGPMGQHNAWQFELRRVFMEPSSLAALTDLFFDMVGHMLPFQIGGMEVAAIPMVAAIVHASIARGTPITGFIVRKERKSYGTGSLIEGAITPYPIIVVDDIINSGGSIEKVRVALEGRNCQIALAFALIDFNSERGLAWRKISRIPVLAPFSVADWGLALRSASAAAHLASFRNVWTFSSPDANFFHRVPKSFPVTDGMHVYFGSDSGKFWCLNAKDGSVSWCFTVKDVGHKNLWSTPALHDDKVYFGSYDGNVYCLNSATGREVWRFCGADWVGSSPTLAVELNLLYVGLEYATEGKRGSVVALRMDTGEKVWEHITRRYTHASPVYWKKRRIVACGSNDNEMFLFDAQDGRMLWRFQTRADNGMKGSIRHAAAFDERRGHIITGCADGYIYIIDVDSGKEVWSVRTDNTIYTIPLVVGDKAYVGSTDKHLYVLNLEGQVVDKKLYAGAKIFCPPRLLEGHIYYGACNGTIYELSVDTDAITGTHQLPDAVTNAMTFNPKTGHFYALTYMNQLFALERNG